jgi:putative ABC transport system ATP-binding protein
VVDLIFAACAARGMTLLLITHDPGLAARCERRVVMDRGRLRESATARPMAVAAP